MTDADRIQTLEARCNTLEAALSAFAIQFMGKPTPAALLAELEAHTRDDVDESEPLAYVLQWLLMSDRTIRAQREVYAAEAAGDAEAVAKATVERDHHNEAMHELSRQFHRQAA